MPSDELVVVKPHPFNAEAGLAQLVSDITPTPGFYVRSNFAVPEVVPDQYRLTVGGAVERPLSLSLDDLRAIGSRTVVSTMECAGNNRLDLAPLPTGEPWQAGAVSTGRWTGVPLSAVIERACLRSDAVEVLAVGADHGKPKDGPGDIPFARSLPLDQARNPDTLLAWEMNGELLPPHHGAPLRLLVPGWYGMASVKWVTRIEAMTEPFTGYYQHDRYIFDYDDGIEPTPVRRMLVKAIILSPADGTTVESGPVTVQGRAWSGEGQVTRVEVAVDGGDAWLEAQLGAVPPSPYAWRTWSFTWQAADRGRHALRARATDSVGNAQPVRARWNRYGYGSNAIRVSTIVVR